MMPKKIILGLITCCFFIVFGTSYSQNYTSNFEEKVVNQYKTDSLHYDFLKSLFAIDSSYTEDRYISNKTKIDHVISQLPERQSSTKREKKRIKKIYDIIHAKFLKKYNEKAMFPDIFEDGNYNCVSASAIYAYVFDKIEVPYYVKEAPSHVYLIAYPKTHNIYLETTVPGAYGFIEPKESDIKKIVDELVNVKLVTKAEVNAKGYKKFYEDYFYGKEFVDKKSLIGMQYYNQSYFDLEKEKYKSAYTNAEKSSIYYNSPTSKLMLKYLILLTLEKLDFSNDDDLDIFYNSLSKLTYKEDIGENNLEVLLNRIKENKNNDFIHKAALKMATLKDSTMGALCQLRLYDYLVRDHSEKQNYDKALMYSEKVLALNPKSKIAKRAIVFSIHRKLDLMPINEKVIKQFDEYSEKFPFINDDKRILTFKASLYGRIAGQYFAARNIKKGLPYFNSFENLLNDEKEKVQINPNAISGLYLILGRYYYGKNQFKSAKNIFEKGLKHTPENFELKKMLKWAKEDMR